MKTKKLILSLLATTLMLFLSCNSDSDQVENTQIDNLTNKVAPGGGGPCPPGSLAVIIYEFDTFRFHRPKKNCESGFWFCSDGEWVITCIENPNGRRYSGITETTTTVAGVIDRDNGLISFRFPIELITKDGNKPSDFEIFNVDEELTFGDLTLIKGDYSSTFTNDEITVNVPVK
mgnify:CR=1 FL=1